MGADFCADHQFPRALGRRPYSQRAGGSACGILRCYQRTDGEGLSAILSRRGRRACHVLPSEAATRTQGIWTDHVSMAALQHFFIRHMRMTASDAISALPSIIEDLQAKAKSDADDDTASDKTAENKIAKPSENANVTKRASGMMAENAANLPRTRAENNVVHVHIHANGEPAQ